jgi:cell division septation protein DedD
MKDKEISEEELLDELDTMYQRVADIEKEEAAETPTLVRTKPKRNKRRSYRTVIVVIFVFFIILASILAITIFDPITLLQRLTMRDKQPSTVITSPAPPKRSTVVSSPVPPTPPSVATSPEASPPSSVGTSPPAPSPPSAVPSPAPPKSPSESFPVQTKQEPVRSPREEAEKPKSISQEIVKLNKPLPQGKYYAIQVGSFRDMENVRELTQVFKKEGLDAYWITMKSKGRGTLYRVLVGQFMDENEAAQFLKEKKILKNYPDSFIKEVSSSKIDR